MNKQNKVSCKQAIALKAIHTLTTKLNREWTVLLQVQAKRPTEWQVKEQH